MAAFRAAAPPIVHHEELGRVITSRREAKRVRRGRSPVRSFLPKRGERRLSVDRLTFAPLAEAIANGERVAQARQQGHLRTAGRPSTDVHFCGWSVISVLAARATDCSVEATPIEGEHGTGNPYHADIVLPRRVETDDIERKRYAQRLARAAVWRDRPTLSTDRS